MMRRGATLLAAGLAACAAGVALAGEPVQTQTKPASEKPSLGSLLSNIARQAAPDEPNLADPALQAALKDLDAENFDTREAATSRLAADTSISNASLEAVAGQGHLTPEAHARVLEALRCRFEADPRPAIGISMQQPMGPEGVGVAGVSPAFPASNVLQENDVIVIIAGVSLENTLTGSELLRDVVRSFLPDEEIPMTVVRGEQRLHLRTPLGRYEDLQQGVAAQPEELARSWDIRIRRRGLVPDDQRVIDVAAPRGAWHLQRRGAYDTWTEGGLVAGGQASARQDERLPLQASTGRWRDGVARERGGFRAAENAVNALPAQPPRVALRDIIMKRVEEMRDEIRADSERLADPRLTPEERQALQRSVILRSREVQNLADQLQQFPPMP